MANFLICDGGTRTISAGKIKATTQSLRFKREVVAHCASSPGPKPLGKEVIAFKGAEDAANCQTLTLSEYQFSIIAYAVPFCVSF